MRTYLALTVLFYSLLFAKAASAIVESTGTLDSQFDAGNFTNGHVSSVLVQPDGKFLVAGSFSKANGVPRHCIARFNPDGTLDASFNPGTGPDGEPSGMILQSDGKILIYGGGPAAPNGFGSVDGVSRIAGVARLNSNGSLDASFDPAVVGSILAAALQPDGKVILAGNFGFPTNGPQYYIAIARFNSDGSLDSTFDAGYLFSPSDTSGGATTPVITSLARQKVGPNAGKLIIVGDFNNGTQQPDLPGVLRLNPDGSFDDTFSSIVGAVAPVASVAGLSVQSDDKIVVFGGFNSFNGVACHGLVRLSANGPSDNTFSTGTFKNYSDPGKIAAVSQQGDGKLVVGGNFHALDGTGTNNLVRLLSNGARDSSFDSSTGPGALGLGVSALAIRPSDQEIIAGGSFATCGTSNRNNIALVKIDGSNDPAFAPSEGLTDGTPTIYASAVQPDGKIVLGGSFTVLNGVPTYNLVRLNADGTRDSSFGIILGVNGAVRALGLQPDGKIIVGGDFTAVDGVPTGRIARLNANGALDAGFNTGAGLDGICYAVATDAAGNIYVGGNFLNANGVSRVRVAKFTSGGALDLNFDPGYGADAIVFAIAPPNGSAGPVIGGSFLGYNGQSATYIARLDSATGALDPVFANSVRNGFSNNPRAILLQNDGKYMVCGNFSRFGSTPRYRLARLNSDGSLDDTFTGQGVTYGRALAQQNSKILVAGYSISSHSIFRLSSTNGSYDTTFNIGTGPTVTPPEARTFEGQSSIETLAITPDGKLIAGGIFNQYNGVARSAVVRLTDKTLRVGSITRLPNLHITLSIFGAPNTSYTLKSSPDPVAANFTTLATITTDGGGFFLYDDAGAATLSVRFYEVTGPTAPTTDGAQFRPSLSVTTPVILPFPTLAD